MLALAGGVGGAKLALGLAKVLSPERLTIVVNTGDDEQFHGLHVSPDLDTVMYTLAGVANPVTGWGLAGDTFEALGQLRRYGAETWFNLGDRDLATHIRRTQMLREGRTLSEATAALSAALGVGHAVVPMSDAPVRTVLATPIGDLPMQTYFVKHRCGPEVREVRFDGASEAGPSPAFDLALRSASHIVFCPSNPFVSVAPVLAVQGVRERVEAFGGLRVAVSPIVGGQALRGPAAKMLAEMGHEPSCVGVARLYRELCDIFVIDEVDRARRGDVEALGLRAEVAPTVMADEGDKVRLARFVCSLLEKPAGAGIGGGR